MQHPSSMKTTANRGKDGKIRVAIADKNPLVQAGLKQILGEDGRFRVACVSADAAAFIAALEDTPADVAVVGWILPGGGGKFILDHLVGHEGAPRVAIYTGAEGEAVAAQVMAHGGAAYVSKSEPPEDLVATIADVAEGKMVFPYLDIRRIHDNPMTALTRRELEVLSALVAGHTNKQIANDQDVSPNTLKFHVKNLFSKLGVSNRSQAVALYLRS